MKTQKVKKATLYAFDAKSGFFTDGNFAIKKEYIELDTPMLQVAMLSGISFYFTSLTLKSTPLYSLEDVQKQSIAVPPMADIVPKFPGPDELIDLKCLAEITGGKTKARVFGNVNAAATELHFLNDEYVKLFPPTTKFYSNGFLSGKAAIYGGEVIGIIMPIDSRKSELIDYINR